MHSTTANFVRETVKPLIVALSMILSVQQTHAQTAVGTEISYGRSGMKINGSVLNGTFDFQFKLFDAQNGGTLIAPPITRNDIVVNNGVLKPLLLDFGDDAFNGQARFIDVKARQGSNGFLAVGPRQEFVPVPYALALPGMRTVPGTSCPNVVGGFAGNIVGNDGNTIGGGGQAGNENAAASAFATVAGGVKNTASGSASFVGGGFNNLASGSDSVVGGGLGNHATNTAATVCGGSSNLASGVQSFVAGGVENVASGTLSFAAGNRAKATGVGTFVWADASNQDYAVGGDNRFAVRATGGAEVFTSANLSTGVFIEEGGSAWSSVSDRNVKTNVQEVDTRRLLERLCAIPITTWNYKAQDESIRHIGPMAQDFHAAFGVGESDKRITTIDADGVLFAAVQGLHQRALEDVQELHNALAEKDARISAQAQQIEELGQRLADLEQRVSRWGSD